MEQNLRYAVLIDSDNVSARYVKEIFSELANYGMVTIARIYGNWQKNTDWKQEILLEYSLTPVQQFSYTSGKNATDMAMVIDAMDILYGEKVDGFCLVTSDSDFTRLAARLRESNVHVIGMGESKTPLALRKACNKFILLNLISEAEGGAGQKGMQASEDAVSITSIERLERELLTYVSESDDGKVLLANAGQLLNNRYSDYDPRNYGYAKLSTMVEDGMKNLKIVMEKDVAYLLREDQLDREIIIEDIISYIQEQGGKVENLSAINDMLHAKYSGFDTKSYGYNRLSSFLRSIKDVKVWGNTVSIRKK
ncbi:MAG: NYN domain-containing protein [Lachnospiraceae bacterium]|nr:NYN domain-containing protein [Lachnospiraceae bacterium]